VPREASLHEPADQRPYTVSVEQGPRVLHLELQDGVEDADMPAVGAHQGEPRGAISAAGLAPEPGQDIGKGADRRHQSMDDGGVGDG
jgi:hypothetical protein